MLDYELGFLDEKPIYEYPLNEQIPEIKRRLVKLFKHAAKNDRAVTVTEIRLALRINEHTLARWMRGENYMKYDGKCLISDIATSAKGRTKEEVEEEERLLRERTNLLNDFYVASQVSVEQVATSSNSKSAVTGANMILQQLYSIGGEKESRERSTSWEGVLQRAVTTDIADIRKARKERQNARKEQAAGNDGK